MASLEAAVACWLVAVVAADVSTTFVHRDRAMELGAVVSDLVDPLVSILHRNLTRRLDKI